MKPTTKNILYMLKESNAIEDVRDRYALINAHRAWKYLIAQDKLTPEVIKETHRLLMVGQWVEPKHRGDWRDAPVWIGGEKKVQPKIVLQSLISDLCDDINQLVADKNLNADPVTYHIRFEQIHPFIDGNGRIGRMILNWHLLKLGAPLLVYTEANKHIYYMLFPSYRASVNQRFFASILKGML